MKSEESQGIGADLAQAGLHVERTSSNLHRRSFDAARDALMVVEVLSSMRQKTVTTAYAGRATEYTKRLGLMDVVAAEDRSLVENWARSVGGALADLGCGPGHWTAHLASLGHDVVGIEPVEEFLALARRAHPEAHFEAGSFETLPGGSFDGILSWYSIIHTPPPQMPLLLERAHAALRPGGSLLLGFFAGERVEPFDHAVTTAWFWPLLELSGLVTNAGFTVTRHGTRKDPDARRHGWLEATGG